MEIKNLKADERIINNLAIFRCMLFALSGMYVELVFHAAIYGMTGKEAIIPVLFGMAAFMVAGVICSLFSKLVNRILGYLFMAVLCIYYITQLIYYRIFDTFLSLVSVGGAENAMNFKVVLVEKLRQNVLYIIALILPVILLVILDIFVFRTNRLKGKRLVAVALSCVLGFVIAISILPLCGRNNYSPYDLFHNRYVLELSMEKLGVMVTTAKDGIELISGGSDNKNTFVINNDMDNKPDYFTYIIGSSKTPLYDEDGKRYVVYKPQTDDSIDFKAVYENSDDETLKNLTAYLSNLEPTMDNNYTGLFEGYNVVFVTAESLSPYAVSEKWTPTLYKIMNDGFVYNNFYNPRWYHSTIDGEYVNCLGQYPCSSDWSFYKSAETYQPYALGNAMGELGYTCKAYHDFTFYYYNRSETHANMGYDFKAIDYGLELPYYTPYSDLDMMKAACDDFIDDEPFVAYFMTFSGHLPYNYGYNAMSVKNREEAESKTKDMGLSEEAVAYIASQMELDKALEYLMDELDKAGKLDNTVFIVTPDHYPYGLTKTTFNELAGFDAYDDHFELHKSCLGIWSKAMEDGTLTLRDGTKFDGAVTTDKLCASVDILPTILNMLGVKYDSRLLAGHDIMSDGNELVIFADHSFITDKLKYNTSTGEVTYLVDKSEVPDDYIDEMIEKVENILYMSDEIIDEDYFKVVY